MLWLLSSPEISGEKLMTMLSGTGIQEALEQGDLKIEPLSTEGLQPSSVDLRLGRRYLKLKDGVTLDAHKDNSEHFDPYFISDFLELSPGVLILGETMECVTLSETLVANIHGRSSFGRLGVLVHVTAGLVDPGWHGILTLELMNITQGPVRLYVGDRIAQLTVQRLAGPSGGVRMVYNGKYNGADDPQASRSYLDGPFSVQKVAQLNSFRRG
jgi:dCTP deaminase